jgi:chitin disaccharide deacetylase
MKLTLCADDYGLAPGVTSAIEQLVLKGRLNAFSIMVDGPEINISSLRELKRDFPHVSIGLHLTLTKVFEEKPSLILLMVQAFTRLLPNPSLEIKRQFEKFETLAGFPPDHVDGHQHVHLLPGIRECVFKLMPESAVFRQCKGAGVGFKAKIIDALSRKVPPAIIINAHFSGSYHFMHGGDYRALFKQFIASQHEGLLVMCHPGRVDDLLKSRDPVHEDREIELAYFLSDEFLHDVREAGYVL